MKKSGLRQLLLLFTLLTLLFSLSACGNEEPAPPQESPIASEDSVPYSEPELLGSWVWDGGWDYTYHFNGDGTGSYTYGDQELLFDFTDNGDHVVIQYRNATEPNVFHYHVNGTVLSIEDSFGQYVTYLKTENGVILSPLEKLYVDFTPEMTAKMSTFINFGYYAVCGDSIYGVGHNNSGITQFARYDMKQNGDFAEVDSYEIIDRNITPTYIAEHGDDLYYIRDWDGLYKIGKDGGTPQCVISEPVDYAQILNDKIYFCNEDYNFCRADLDGSNVEVLVYKEMYYTYLLDENWLIYQDDADNESLHLYHLLTGTDVAISDAPSYSPIIVDSTVYFALKENGIQTFARVDLNDVEITYDDATGSAQHRFNVETTGNPITTDLAITADHYCYNGTNTGYDTDHWTYLKNESGVSERTYAYTGIDYNVFWELNSEGLVSHIYVTLNATGGSQTVPRTN
ncbi:MAG: DUF5050 domain-containing protein [Oscillospiraceae bacterium]|nr:DUF5050 domain-containing protein [Oscillospiraceae bacterium]